MATDFESRNPVTFYITLRFGQGGLTLLSLIPSIRSPLHYELRFWWFFIFLYYLAVRSRGCNVNDGQKG